jgi:hypothetical protein
VAIRKVHFQTFEKSLLKDNRPCELNGHLAGDHFLVLEFFGKGFEHVGTNFGKLRNPPWRTQVKEAQHSTCNFLGNYGQSNLEAVDCPPVNLRKNNVFFAICSWAIQVTANSPHL